jgi:hypothetical protein
MVTAAAEHGRRAANDTFRKMIEPRACSKSFGGTAP